VRILKLYPFSVQNHAHDIEFRKNRVWNEMNDMETGEVPWDDVKYEKMEALLEQLMDLHLAMFNSRDGRIVYLNGRQIGLAKETVLWAANERGRLGESGPSIREKIESVQKNQQDLARIAQTERGRE
jgi:hypothetical protein